MGFKDIYNNIKKYLAQNNIAEPIRSIPLQNPEWFSQNFKKRFMIEEPKYASRAISAPPMTEDVENIVVSD